MQIGYIGLGKMGQNMVLRLLEKGHNVVAWNRSPEPGKVVAKAGATVVPNLDALVEQVKKPRVIWLMLPAGDITEQYIQTLIPLLQPGDTLIDGANSLYKDSQRRGKLLHDEYGIHFLDVGVSGGPGGARNGACLMIGGEAKTYAHLQPLFEDIASEDAYQFFPGYGAGHFVKMVHNGIEYGMMQAIAEGFAVMKASEYDLDLGKVADIYQHRSVIESRLVGWAQSGFKRFGQDLEEVTPTIAHTGEGEWTVHAAKELGIPVPIIEGSFRFRVESAKNPAYTNKVVSMLRHEFGGHATK